MYSLKIFNHQHFTILANFVMTLWWTPVSEEDYDLTSVSSSGGENVSENGTWTDRDRWGKTLKTKSYLYITW